MTAGYRFLLGASLAAALLIVPEAMPVPFAGLWGASKAFAQSDDQERRRSKKVDSLRAPVYEKIAKAQEKLETDERAEGIEDLRDMLDDGLNDYETAIVLQIFAQIAMDKEDYEAAIGHFSRILSFERVPESITITSLNALAQLYLITEQYRNSIDYMNRWLAFQQNPGPTPYYFLAQAYYGLEDFENIIPNAEKAIDLARAQGIEVKENYWLLLRLAYFELGNFRKVAETLEILAVNYDKGEYWLQLSAIYSELGEEQKQLSAMEVAYRRGYIETDNNLTNLAQLYLYHNIPIKAAWVIEKGMKDEILEKDADTYELLGQAYLNAQEMQKAQRPLEIAAEEADDGEIWMRLGQVFIELEQWDKAVEPLRKAADSSDDLKEPGFAHLLLGMAYFYSDKFDDARRSFREARRFDETEEPASKWIAYVGDELKRRAQLSEYYGGGQ